MKRRRKIWGTNELPCRPKKPFWKLILKQFDDLLVKILLAAAVISFFLGVANDEGSYALVEPGVILIILVANASVGVLTETNAAKAIEELGSYQADVATVLRDGNLRVFPSAELVPGDVVELAVGDKIPADVRLWNMKGSSFRVDQALLTGESDSVLKSVEAISTVGAVLQDKTCMAYSGTVVTAGRARGVVVGTGMRTAIGKIQDAMYSVDNMDDTTPLKRKLDDISSSGNQDLNRVHLQLLPSRLNRAVWRPWAISDALPEFSHSCRTTSRLVFFAGRATRLLKI